LQEFVAGNGRLQSALFQIAIAEHLLCGIQTHQENPELFDGKAGFLRQRSHSGVTRLFSYHPDIQSPCYRANRRGQRIRRGMPIADFNFSRQAYSSAQIPIFVHAIREIDHMNSNTWREFAT